MNINQGATLTNINEKFEIAAKESFSGYVECEKLSNGTYSSVFTSGLFKLYQAATKVSEQRIQELEAEIKHLLADHLSHSDIYEQYCKMSEKKILELTASNNQLREALEVECGGRCNAEYNPCNARLVLSSTPAKSLAEHDNQLIQMCADKAEEMALYAGIDIAEAIRLLKVTP